MSALAKKAINILKAKGFVETLDKDCVLSCQAYMSEVVPMKVAVYNNRFMVITVNDESIVFMNKIKQEDCPVLYGFPYNMEFECDLSIIDAIYGSDSPYMDTDIAAMMDGVTILGHFDMTNSYGFCLQGVAPDPHKIIISITPPNIE
jgi:hypothetical protein